MYTNYFNKDDELISNRKKLIITTVNGSMDAQPRVN